VARRRRDRRPARPRAAAWRARPHGRRHGVTFIPQ
jgi:hypothetical protein